jgi:hypothetical protein
MLPVQHQKVAAMGAEEMEIVAVTKVEQIKTVTKEEKKQMEVPISNLTQILLRKLNRLIKLRAKKKPNLNLLHN